MIQIGGCFRFGGDHSLNVILCLRETEHVKGDGVFTISFETEVELLMAWTELIRLQDPDILTGWNIDGFDNKYIADRARELGISDRVMDFSRINDPG